ncbi:MAG: N-acetylglucosamine kinase [Nocardioides sp.]
MTASSIDAGGLALGGDLGGTSTRILVTDLDGHPLGRGRAGGGNPTAHPTTARDALASALTQALRDVDPGRVRAGVLGMAGGGALRDPSVRTAYDEAWRAAGLPGRPEVRSDVEVAFAAGSDATTGTVLVAGTGAVAGRVEDGRLVATAGGHGWLLGDEGSGFWFGREAVRAALRWVGTDEEPGPLVRSVLATLPETDDDPRTALVQHAYAGPPVALAALAPLVTAANDGGDPVAAEIVASGLAHLIALLDRLPEPTPGEPVVLAGALTERGTAIGHGLRHHLGERGLDVLSAAEPVTGAAALARRLATAGPRG